MEPPNRGGCVGFHDHIIIAEPHFSPLPRWTITCLDLRDRTLFLTSS